MAATELLSDLVIEIDPPSESVSSATATEPAGESEVAVATIELASEPVSITDPVQPGGPDHTVVESVPPTEPDHSVTDFFVEMIARPNPSKVMLGLCRDGFFPYGVNGNDPRIRRLLRHYFPAECPYDDATVNRFVEKDEDGSEGADSLEA